MCSIIEINSLGHAILSGNTALVKRILELIPKEDININAKIKQLKACINPRCKNKGLLGWSPLMMVILMPNKNLEIVKKLIELNVTLEVPDDGKGDNLFHFCAHLCLSFEVAKYLF